MAEVVVVPPKTEFTEYDFASDHTMRKALRDPFPREQIGSLPKGGVRLDYVGHAAVTDRLNKVAPGWTYEITRFVEFERDGTPHLLAVFGSMTIGSVTRWEAGDVDRSSTYGQELKLAMSDFIRRAAMRFGVALDLWSREELSGGSGSFSPPPDPDSGGIPTAMGSSSPPGSDLSGEEREPSPGKGAGRPSAEGSTARALPPDYIAPPPEGHVHRWKQSPRVSTFEVCADWPSCTATRRKATIS